MFSSDVLERKRFHPVDFVVTLWNVTHVRCKILLFMILPKCNLYCIFYIVWKVHYQHSSRARYLNQMLNATSFISVWSWFPILLQLLSEVLGGLCFLPLLFFSLPTPGPMLIKTLMFVRILLFCYTPTLSWGDRGYVARENSLFSGLKWTTVKLYNLPNYFCLWL